MTEKQKEKLINKMNVCLMAANMENGHGNDTLINNQRLICRGMLSALRIMGFNVVLSADDHNVVIDIVQIDEQ